MVRRFFAPLTGTALQSEKDNRKVDEERISSLAEMQGDGMSVIEKYLRSVE
jgi:hypothetical protein